MARFQKHCIIQVTSEKQCTTKVLHQQASRKLNSGVKGSDILWSIHARKRVLEKAVKVTVKENEKEIKSNDQFYS